MHYYPEFSPVWNIQYQGKAVELYDHWLDPQENHNVAYEHKYTQVAQQLQNQLRAGWTGSLPTDYI